MIDSHAKSKADRLLQIMSTLYEEDVTVSEKTDGVLFTIETADVKIFMSFTEEELIEKSMRLLLDDVLKGRNYVFPYI